jgi:hypothetical protein
VINIDLNSPSPQLAVEANLTDQDAPAIVILTESINLYEIAQVPPVTGAVVEINDSASGVREVLHETSAGVYRTSLLKGIPGHRYILKIATGGHDYRAVSEMPLPVGFYKLEIVPELHTDGDTTIRYRVKYQIEDPPGYDNYYRVFVYNKGLEISSRRVTSDQFHEGRIIADDFVIHESSGFSPGDTIRIELHSIDKYTYTFFRTLREGASGSSFLSVSPSNPASNISGDGLGYFSAASVTEGYLVVPVVK